MCDEIPWNSQSCRWPVLWSAGPLVLWSPGPLVLWSAGPLQSAGPHWSASPLVLWSFVFLSLFLSFFLFRSCSPFSFLLLNFAFPFVRFAETKPNKEASKHELLTFGSGVLLGGGTAPPPTPPCATKSALHPRHPRLPRNQYFEVNSPVQNFLTKQICLLYRLYLSIYLSIDLSIYRSIYLSIFRTVLLRVGVFLLAFGLHSFSPGSNPLHGWATGIEPVHTSIFVHMSV